MGMRERQDFARHESCESPSEILQSKALRFPICPWIRGNRNNRIPNILTWDSYEVYGRLKEKGGNGAFKEENPASTHRGH
jgi:hypothetical protein